MTTYETDKVSLYLVRLQTLNPAELNRGEMCNEKIAREGEGRARIVVTLLLLSFGETTTTTTDVALVRCRARKKKRGTRSSAVIANRTAVPGVCCRW
jgi:hypothetical protein